MQWGNLDYLLVNLPPGIGDVQLALAQALPIYGVVMIATAQQETHSDTYETLKMFEQLKVPIFGLVENMSNKMAPDMSQQKYEIQDGENLTPKIRVPYLGCIPLDSTVPQYRDRGLPMVLAEPSSIFVSTLNTIAWEIASQTTISGLKS
ncbi:Iron-sulfur cluster carrier protein (fragment) [Hyella patelloides LEGE 07179]|uniref:Iron-sulfur cluster carrier protein n=1 Tax=Hyella patelloides LEGE 07179 TaxID=945734 RepID=A0A563VM88_9CYAN